MSFRSDDRISIFGMLRPGPGQTVTRAVVATYSLDLVALLGFVLALGGDADMEFETSPLGLVRAFDAMRGRLIVLHQLGRVVAPSAHRSILPLLDTMVRAIPADERSESWHPKVALIRYIRGGEVEWRFWMGSRNLTGSTDLDAGILLVSTKLKSSKTIPEIAKLAGDLLEEAELTLSELSELKNARWRSPAGVAVKDLRWRRPGETRRFLSDPLIVRADRACAVSPFIDRRGLNEVLGAGSANVTLLTTETAGIACAPLKGIDFRSHTPPDPVAQVSVEQQQEGSKGEFVEPPSTGVHAKLVAIAKGARTVLMLGSANLTKRGLVGPNAEAVAILDVTDAALSKSLFDFAEGGLELGTARSEEELVEMKKAERQLDGLISIFLKLPLRVSYDENGLSLTIAADADDVILRLASFATSPFSDWDAWSPIPQGAKSVRLRSSPVPLSEQTTLLNFRATSLADPAIQRTWVQTVPTDTFDDESRDRALLARYVGASRFRDWLRSLLDGVDGTAGQRWTDPARLRICVDASGRLAELFTLETMLAAWARDPAAFEARVSGMTEMLESFAEAFATIPDDGEREAALTDLAEVRPFLEALKDAIGDLR
ncbi:hypothetical protein J2X36_002729 [Methylobacterium sp. BE186]|uniref:hypothetical protein n=1 Tax=Methylobacterium sp. BE186 TaxID=2817715 RepID=UPI00285DF9CF|nr:hypothetical protein [Methylobacterium sp. BE186]MDR7037974.1 hypothetical protein [Methylobacterium sp. BE186]